MISNDDLEQIRERAEEDYGRTDRRMLLAEVDRLMGQVANLSGLLQKAVLERDEACGELIAERELTRAAVVKALRDAAKESPQAKGALTKRADEIEYPETFGYHVEGGRAFDGQGRPL